MGHAGSDTTSAAPEIPADLVAEIARAEHRIRGYVRETPLQRSLVLGHAADCNVFLKLENLQHTGSFKLRGAMNKLLSLSPEQKERGAVTASTGNHGLAVAYSLKALDMKGVVFVPETVSAPKREAIRTYGAEVTARGADNCAAQAFAREYAAEHEMVFVAPYNDLQVVAGQGTIAVEISREIDHVAEGQAPSAARAARTGVDAIFVCLGGGGLVSGVGAYLKSVMPDVTVFGCSPKNSAGMIASVEAGRIVEIKIKPTLSDGSAGGSIVPGSITFDLCRAIVDRYNLVTEDEIKETLLSFIASHHLLIEGSAAVAVASFLKHKEEFRGKNVVVLLCGSNIDLDTLRSIL